MRKLLAQSQTILATLVLIQYDNVVFSAAEVFRYKAQCAGNGTVFF